MTNHLEVTALQEHTVKVLTKKEKLTRFAELVRKNDGVCSLYHLLERCDLATKMATGIVGSSTAFGIAAADPVFQAGGIGQSVSSAQKYLELSDEELHEFSCDCGGMLSNDEQADHIQDIANKS